MSQNNLKYKRVLLKISGEALMGEQGFGIDPEVVNTVAAEIKKAHNLGAGIAVVVGGGNIFRGVQNSTKLGMDQASADYVGMLATVMNALVLQGVLKKLDVPTRVQTAITMNAIAEPYIRLKAMRHLEKGRVVIFAAGTGNPFFSTDTAASLRAAEIGAEVMLMAKNKVNGVYNKDPRKFPDAVKYDRITYDDMIVQNLKVIDTTAVALCKNNDTPIIVFNFAENGSIERILKGETVGTYVGGE
ncbi:MAG: UMP kinase [Candidatus Gastranaerophilales bacterium]|nr:UMP kinase [Candidatus Gastranaerophilales bacterium]